MLALEERYRHGMERYHHNQTIRQSIKKKLDNANTIKNQIETKIGAKIHFLLEKHGWIPIDQLNYNVKQAHYSSM